MGPKGRAAVFVIQAIYLALLVALALMYLAGGLAGWLTDLKLDGLGIKPGVLFFGALGGVAISLAGVFDHMYDWDDRYIYWHVARPFVGAVVAVVAVLIIQAGILAVGVEPTEKGAGAKDLLYYVIAFIVGYREKTFRDMVKKAADLIFTSPSEGSAPVLSLVSPDRGPAGTQVTISGSGLKETEVVWFGPNKADFVPASDGEVVATAPKGQGASRVSVVLVTPRGATVAPQVYEYTQP